MTKTITTKRREPTRRNNAYTLDQVRLAKRLLLDAEYETRVASGELKRISAETGITVPMLSAIAYARTYADVEPAPATKGD